MDVTLSEETKRHAGARLYCLCVIKINDYLKEFLPVIVGGNATKLSENELLDLLEFRIPIE